jgi:hypothetical protein
LALVLRDLRSSTDGLSSREAARRLIQYGRNELSMRGGRRWPGELLRQLTHPLALLLWAAAALSLAVGNTTVAIALLLVIGFNAAFAFAFAFAQEQQAERAVEALAGYLPQRVTALQDGRPRDLVAAEVVPGMCWSSRKATGSQPICVCSRGRSRSTCRRSPASPCHRFARRRSRTRTCRFWARGNWH